MLTFKNSFEEYCKPSKYIDWQKDEILQKAGQLRTASANKWNFAVRTYHFVRDEIKHTWDVQDKRVTITASDVLREKVGMCWAKANLLAGLLRANGIPAGICYQRLTLGGYSAKRILHSCAQCHVFKKLKRMDPC